MKIIDLHIDAFGHFSQRRFELLESPVTVFYGPNEAGKTTLLEFIRSMLFGFRDGRSRNRNLYDPISGERHKGSVTVLSDADETITIRRTHGAGGGKVTLTSQSGAVIPDAELTRLLGNHSRDTFENIFAFTLEELYSDALVSDDKVNGGLYSAGIGASRLPDAVKDLDTEKTKLFRPGGSTQQIYYAANKIDELNSQLDEIENNASEYARQGERRRNIELELTSLRQEQRSHESRRRHLTTLQTAWEDWNDLETARRQIRQLADFSDIPAVAVTRINDLETRASSAREEVNAASERVRVGEDALAVPLENLSIIQHTEAIRHIQSRRTEFDKAVEDLPKRNEELAELHSNSSETLSELGPDWNAERLDEFDLSLIVREEITGHAERLNRAQTVADRAKSELAASETMLEEAQREEHTAQEAVDDAQRPEMDFEGILDRRNRIHRARDILTRRDRSNDRLQDLRDRLAEQEAAASLSATPSTVISRNGRSLAIVLGLAGIIILLLGVLLIGNQIAMTLAFVTGLFTLGIAAYIAIIARRTSRQGLTHVESPAAARTLTQIEEEERQLSETDAPLAEHADALGLDSIDTDALADAESLLNREQRLLDEWNRLNESSKASRDKLERQKERLVKSMEAVEEGKRNLDSAHKDWGRWLSERGLRAAFSPNSIEMLSKLVEQGRDRLRSMRSTERQIDAMRASISEFIEILHPAATDHGFYFDPNDYARAAAVSDDLINLHAKVEKESAKRRSAEIDLKRAKDDLDGRKQNLSEILQEIANILDAHGASDADEFRIRADLCTKRDDALDRLQRISGPGDALEDMMKTLSETNKQTLDANFVGMDEQLEEIKERIDAFTEESGAIREKLGRLLGEEESSKLRTDRARLQEEIRAHAREWTVRTVAENLLSEARRKFEKERQPDVIRHSEEFFRNITDGRYQNVFSPLGESEIRVTESNGVSKQPLQLSRGTREQLFLSLRFGLIRELGARSERLPVIVDETLINFDPERALRAASAFIELSERNQILVFTCHPQVMELFQEAARKSHALEPEIVRI